MGLLAYGLIALSIIGILSGIGYQIRESGKEAVRLEWAEANKLAREAEEKKANQAATNLEATRVEYRTKYRTITQAVDKIVDRVEYRHVCLDADGLRLANCAILGKSADSCKPDDGVPKPAPAGGRTGGIALTLDNRGL